MDNYSYFQDGITNDNILNMLLKGKLSCVCFNCKKINIVSPENSLFKCTSCNKKQYIATLNPNELQKER